jgi:hypothetical protein
MNGKLAPALFFGLKFPERLLMVRASVAACSVDVQSVRPIPLIVTGFRSRTWAVMSAG